MGLGGVSTTHVCVGESVGNRGRTSCGACAAMARIGRRLALPSVGVQTNIARIDSLTSRANYAAIFLAHACIFALVQSRWLHEDFAQVDAS